MTITWRGPLLLASLIAVLVFAGCGGDDKDSSTSTAAATQAAAATTQDSGGTTTAEAPTEGSGGDGDFCKQLENIGENLQDQTAMTDPQKVGAYFSRVADALDAADPPSEVQDDWNTLRDLFSTFAETFKDADFTDPQSLAGLQDDLQKFQDKQAELASATTALSQYAADNCGGGF